MKGSLAIAIISTAVCCINAKATQEISDKVKSNAVKCKVLHKIDDEMFNNFVKKHEVAEDENLKCMLACMMEGMGYRHDGKFDIDAINTANKEKWDNEEIVNKANAASKHCIDEVGTETNECELAYKMTVCLVQQAKEHDIPKPEYQ